MKLTISVTQDHIDRGEQRSCSYCPVALAVRDALDLANFQHFLVSVAVDVLVFSQKDNVTAPTARYEARLPTHVVEWIQNFDRQPSYPNKKAVLPFVEEIELRECAA